MKALLLHDLELVLRNAQRAADTLKGASILVTGANGFIGSWLAQAGAYLDLNITPATRSTHGDIRSITIPPHISHVIHTASASRSTDHPADTIGAIVEGTRRVASECHRVNARLLLLSSGSVYLDGNHPTESTARRTSSGTTFPEWVAFAKTQAENAATDAKLRHLSIARIFALLGPGLPPQFAAADFMRTSLDGKPITVLNPATARSYLYAADLTAILFNLLAFGGNHHAYNVGADRAISLESLAYEIAAQTTQLHPIIASPTTTPSILIPATTKLRELLSPSIPFLSTVPNAIHRWLAWNNA